MIRRALLGSAVVLVAGLVALPLLADEKKSERWMSEEVQIDKPYNDVVRRVPEVIRECGLVQLAEIDWSRTSGMREPPASGTPRLESEVGSTNLRTYICDSEECLRMIMSAPEHALKLPARFIVFEKDGKTVIRYTKPHSHMVSEHVEMPEKMKTHSEDLEKRLEKIVERLKSAS